MSAFPAGLRGQTAVAFIKTKWPSHYGRLNISTDRAPLHNDVQEFRPSAVVAVGGSGLWLSLRLGRM